ncbi:hypothetical protein ACFYKX_25625 [Cytobacillus sp. FJAT-54145]|uniref:Uncharacterized protein n=1 Tax=Cytobacillus spartinae TaxID=3299023 RepID=A0ABW6KK60_9BACI
MELEKAKSLYVIAKNNLERAEKELSQKREELKPEIENAYTFGHDQGIAFEKYITVTTGIHLHREVFKRAKQALMEHYKN